MIESRILRGVVAEALSMVPPDAFERDIGININLNKVIVLAGIRRSGKTYELYNIMNGLLRKKVPRANLFYMNFEDERLRGLGIDQLDELIKIYYELSGAAKEHKIYLFLDEVQNINGWAQWVRRLYDSTLYKIFVTGSSSKLLSREIATALAGRNVTYTVYPLSFKEFLGIKGIKLDSKQFYAKRRVFNRHLYEYLRMGGFPEVSLIEDQNDKIRVLSSYYDAIAYRDVIERYKVRDTNALSMTFRYAISTYAKSFSATKTYNYFKSIGIGISKKTINSFINYGESVFLFYHLYKFSKSFKKLHQSRKKIYVTDSGLLRLFENAEDYGRLLENAVCIELLRRKDKDPLLEISYLEGRDGEVDFAVSRYKKVIELIQVTFELNKSNEDRELGPLASSLRELGAESATVITFDSEGERKIGGKIVSVIPFALWQCGASD